MPLLLATGACSLLDCESRRTQLALACCADTASRRMASSRLVLTATRALPKQLDLLCCYVSSNLQPSALVASTCTETGGTGLQIDRNVEREVMYHSQLHHANVVGFKRVFNTQESLCLVLEYANGGELFDKVKSAGCFKEDMARFFFQQLLSGAEYLHECGVAHRDLKLECAPSTSAARGGHPQCLTLAFAVTFCP